MILVTKLENDEAFASHHSIFMSFVAMSDDL